VAGCRWASSMRVGDGEYPSERFTKLGGAGERQGDERQLRPIATLKGVHSAETAGHEETFRRERESYWDVVAPVRAIWTHAAAAWRTANDASRQLHPRFCYHYGHDPGVDKPAVASQRRASITYIPVSQTIRSVSSRMWRRS
jgi:hypothetical protein